MLKKLLCLTIIQKDDSILLGMKKRGFGQGYWNGFGGKVEDSESMIEAAKRELKEEVGLDAEQLEAVGILTFRLAGLEELLEVHVFRCNQYTGEPAETEEMKPQWFESKNIPFEQMWEDDQYWFPLFLAGKKFVGEFDFDENKKILNSSLKEVTELI